jgi:hypothetical protein
MVDSRKTKIVKGAVIFRIMLHKRIAEIGRNSTKWRETTGQLEK